MLPCLTASNFLHFHSKNKQSDQNQIFTSFKSFKYYFNSRLTGFIVLLAPPSGALVVSQFQDPIQSIHPDIALVVLICSKLCLNAPD